MAASYLSFLSSALLGVALFEWFLKRQRLQGWRLPQGLLTSYLSRLRCHVNLQICAQNIGLGLPMRPLKGSGALTVCMANFDQTEEEQEMRGNQQIKNISTFPSNGLGRGAAVYTTSLKTSTETKSSAVSFTKLWPTFLPCSHSPFLPLLS